MSNIGLAVWVANRFSAVVFSFIMLVNFLISIFSVFTVLVIIGVNMPERVFEMYKIILDKIPILNIIDGKINEKRLEEKETSSTPKKIRLIRRGNNRLCRTIFLLRPFYQALHYFNP